MQSLYERLGGEHAVEAAVCLFYNKVIESPIVGEFFERLDMDAQIVKQKQFMTMAFGGGTRYTGKDLREAHAGLVREYGLTDIHFDEVGRLLQESLEELGVDDVLVNEVLNIVVGTKNDVLGR